MFELISYDPCLLQDDEASTSGQNGAAAGSSTAQDFRQAEVSTSCHTACITGLAQIKI